MHPKSVPLSPFCFYYFLPEWASLVAQIVKNLPAMWETWVQSLGWEDSLEDGMATHSSILAWRIPTDWGVWRATVHEVAKSPTRLSDQTWHTLAWIFVLNVLLGLRVPGSSPFSLGNLLTSLVAQMVKRLTTMQETQVQSLGQEDPLEKEMATHSSILAWRIPCIEEPGRLQSMGSQRVGHDWVISLQSPCSTSQSIILNLFKDVDDDRGCWCLSSLRLAPREQGRNWGNKPGSMSEYRKERHGHGGDEWVGYRNIDQMGLPWWLRW